MTNKPHLKYEDYPLYIAEPLRRVMADISYNEDEDCITIISKNPDRPLTNNEKIKICEYLIIRNNGYKKVHFEREE